MAKVENMDETPISLQDIRDRAFPDTKEEIPLPFLDCLGTCEHWTGVEEAIKTEAKTNKTAIDTKVDAIMTDADTEIKGTTVPGIPTEGGGKNV